MKFPEVGVFVGTLRPTFEGTRSSSRLGPEICIGSPKEPCFGGEGTISGIFVSVPDFLLLSRLLAGQTALPPPIVDPQLVSEATQSAYKGSSNVSANDESAVAGTPRDTKDAPQVTDGFGRSPLGWEGGGRPGARDPGKPWIVLGFVNKHLRRGEWVCNSAPPSG